MEHSGCTLVSPSESLLLLFPGLQLCLSRLCVFSGALTTPLACLNLDLPHISTPCVFAASVLMGAVLNDQTPLLPSPSLPAVCGAVPCCVLQEAIVWMAEHVDLILIFFGEHAAGHPKDHEVVHHLHKHQKHMAHGGKVHHKHHK